VRQGTFVTDGRLLLEVVAVRRPTPGAANLQVLVEDCRDRVGEHAKWRPAEMLMCMFLVRRGPDPPAASPPV
jgi:hypothetical protein